MQFSKIMLTNYIARNGNIYVTCSMISLLQVLWGEMSNYNGIISYLTYLCSLGKGDGSRIFSWGLQGTLKFSTMEKMLGISHSPSFLFKPLNTAEKFLNNFILSQAASWKARNMLGCMREFGLVLSDQNSKFSCNHWIELVGIRTFTKLKKRTDNNLTNCICTFTCNYLFL